MSPDHKISAKRIWPYDIPKGSPLNADLEAVKERRRKSQKSRRLRPMDKRLIEVK